MPTFISPAPFSERLERAVAFALRAYRRDKRLWSRPSYLARVFGVCALVLESGGSEDEAISALLACAIDRRGTDVQLGDIRQGFGDLVATIVAECSDAFDVDPRKGNVYGRTSTAIDRFLGRGIASPDGVEVSGMLLVSSAATYYDARETLEAIRRGEDPFGELPGKKFGTLWAFRAFADAYGTIARRGTRAPHLRFAQLVIELVDTIVGKPVTTEELRAAFAIDDTIDAVEKGMLLESNASR